MPVGGGVPRTGSHRPSAIDCPVPLVGDQAGALATMTGTKEEEFYTPIGPRTRISKLTITNSPPMECGHTMVEIEPTSTKNCVTYDYSWCEDMKTSKRKRLEDSLIMEEEQPISLDTDRCLQAKLVKLIGRLEAETRRLYRIVSENQNTRVDIREGALAVRSIMTQITTQEMMKTITRDTTDTDGAETLGDIKDEACQTDQISVEKETKEIAIQINDAEWTRVNSKITKEEIEKVDGIEEYRRIKNMDWPKEVYSTCHIEGSVTEIGNDTDLLVWEETPKSSRQTEDTFKRYRELGTAKGERAYVFLTSETIDEEGVVTKADQILIKMTTDGTEEDCFRKLKSLKDMMMERGRKRIALYPPCGNQNGPAFRKMAECLLGTIKGIECVIYYHTPAMKEQKPRQRNTDAMIISREKGKSYADQLRRIKDEIKNDKNVEIRKNIRNIRQTKEGDMVITTVPGKDTMVNLKTMLTQMGETKIRLSEASKSKRTTVFLKGMDAVTTKDEVEAAVRAETGEGPIKVGELRPYYGSCQAVTLTVTKEAAETLIKRKGMMVGYNWCRATERLHVTQCYKCWRYGHLAGKCASQDDRSKDCRNCGEAGHVQAQCKQQKKCPLCKKEGHRAGEGACPVLRRALKDARTDRRRQPEEDEKIQDEERNEKEQDGDIEERKDKGKKKYSPNTKFLRNFIDNT